MATAPPWEIPKSANFSTPAASTTVSRSSTQRSNDISFTSHCVAIATFVVADQAIMFWQFCEPVLPDRTVPFIVQMIEPIGGLYQRISGAGACIGQPNTVCGDAKLDLLPCRRRRGSCGDPCRLGVSLQPLEVGANIRRVLVPEVPILLQTFRDDPLQFGGHFGVQPNRWDGCPVQDCFEDYPGALSTEWQSAGCHFIKNHTEGKQVRSRIHFFSANLFGGHIGYGS